MIIAARCKGAGLPPEVSEREEIVAIGFAVVAFSVFALGLPLGSFRRRIFARPATSFDADSISIEQVFYRSADGSLIPMFIAHKKGLRLDRSSPTCLYAYGAFGWVSFMWYQPFVLKWLELGGVYALPGIRGGGEYGESWHVAGMNRNKQNSINDYIAAGEWLIKNGYTYARKIGYSRRQRTVGAPKILGSLQACCLSLLKISRASGAEPWLSGLAPPLAAVTRKC